MGQFREGERGGRGERGEHVSGVGGVGSDMARAAAADSACAREWALIPSVPLWSKSNLDSQSSDLSLEEKCWWSAASEK